MYIDSAPIDFEQNLNQWMFVIRNFIILTSAWLLPIDPILYLSKLWKSGSGIFIDLTSISKSTGALKIGEVCLFFSVSFSFLDEVGKVML